MLTRPATEGDIQAILDMSRKFYYTAEYSRFADYCDDAVTHIAKAMMAEGVFLIAEHEGRAVGMLGMAVVPFMFNHAVKTAHEVIWWVEPDAQGAGAGKALLAALEPACKARDVVSIQMMHLSNSPPQAGAIYEAMGYRYSEKSYTKVLKWVQ